MTLVLISVWGRALLLNGMNAYYRIPYLIEFFVELVDQVFVRWLDCTSHAILVLSIVTPSHILQLSILL